MKTRWIIILIFASFNASAQFYPMEAGGEGGLSSGLNFRVYLEEELSYEALLSFRNNGLQVHLFRQQHTELHYNPNGTLFFVYGFGPHAGFYYTDTYRVFFQDIYFGSKVFTPVVGANGYAALEYRFNEWPASVGLRYKPFLEVSLKQIFAANLFDFGFTFKYRFKPNNAY